MEPRRGAARTGASARALGRQLADAMLALALTQLGFPGDTPLGSYRDYVREAWKVPPLRATRRLLAGARRLDDGPRDRS